MELFCAFDVANETWLKATKTVDSKANGTFKFSDPWKWEKTMPSDPKKMAFLAKKNRKSLLLPHGKTLQVFGCM